MREDFFGKEKFWKRFFL